VVQWFRDAGGEPPVVVEPDPSWPMLFEVFAGELRRALSDLAIRVCHVGSTALPGTPAKPVVDIQVSVPDVADEAAYRPQIESLGWSLRAREPQRRFFRPPTGRPRVVHVHVCSRGSPREREVLLFRDYLRAHEPCRERYGDLKRRLAALPDMDRPTYVDSKQPFIAATLADAEGWALRTGWSATDASDT
jgi:GrpB-like predicted nucleotidyltransferase (UPF0157 family)